MERTFYSLIVSNIIKQKIFKSHEMKEKLYLQISRLNYVKLN